MNKRADFSILTVDDNANNLFALRSLIEQYLDVEILEADSGRRALEIAKERQGQIDLIILDIQMPEMDGFQTAALLKAQAKTRDIPIIFLTAAYKTPEFHEKGYQVGAVDYLLKPIDDNQLINKISTYIRLIDQERQMNRRLEEQVAERTRELNESRSYLQNLINSMGEALLVLDTSGQIIQVNPRACSMLGYEEAALMGLTIGDVFEEEDEIKAKAFMGTWLDALIRSGVLENVEASLIHQDGRRVPILFSRSALTDENGDIKGIICIAKDMTDYQHMTQALMEEAS